MKSPKLNSITTIYPSDVIVNPALMILDLEKEKELFYLANMPKERAPFFIIPSDEILSIVSIQNKLTEFINDDNLNAFTKAWLNFFIKELTAIPAAEIKKARSHLYWTIRNAFRLHDNFKGTEEEQIVLNIIDAIIQEKDNERAYHLIRGLGSNNIIKVWGKLDKFLNDINKIREKNKRFSTKENGKKFESALTKLRQSPVLGSCLEASTQEKRLILGFYYDESGLERAGVNIASPSGNNTLIGIMLDTGKRASLFGEKHAFNFDTVKKIYTVPLNDLDPVKNNSGIELANFAYFQHSIFETQDLIHFFNEETVHGPLRDFWPVEDEAEFYVKLSETVENLQKVRWILDCKLRGLSLNQTEEDIWQKIKAAFSPMVGKIKHYQIQVVTQGKLFLKEGDQIHDRSGVFINCMVARIKSAPPGPAGAYNTFLLDAEPVKNNAEKLVAAYAWQEVTGVFTRIYEKRNYPRDEHTNEVLAGLGYIWRYPKAVIDLFIKPLAPYYLRLISMIKANERVIAPFYLKNEGIIDRLGPILKELDLALKDSEQKLQKRISQETIERVQSSQKLISEKLSAFAPRLENNRGQVENKDIQSLTANQQAASLNKVNKQEPNMGLNLILAAGVASICMMLILYYLLIRKSKNPLPIGRSASNNEDGRKKQKKS